MTYFLIDITTTYLILHLPMYYTTLTHYFNEIFPKLKNKKFTSQLYILGLADSRLLMLTITFNFEYHTFLRGLLLLFNSFL